MIDLYISDSALQILSQLLVIVTYISVMCMCNMKKKKLYIFAGTAYAVISIMFVYNVFANIVFAILFCFFTLFINDFRNSLWIISITVAYLLVNNISLIVISNQETLFYMMLKLMALNCAYFVFQIVLFINNKEVIRRYLPFQILIFVFCFSANMLLVLYNKNMRFGTRDILFFPVFVNSILYIVISALLHVFIKSQNIQESLKIQKIKNEMIKKEYVVLKEKYEDISVMRHDMKHHLQMLSVLIYQGKNEKAEAYINMFSDYIKDNSLIFVSTNQMLEIVINEKYKEATKLGINMIINCENVKLDFINDVDIIAIFANALDNAIEASLMLKEQKEITVTLLEQKHYIIFEVINRYEHELQERNNKLQTTKKGHAGLGITSIVKTVERYKGIVKTDYNSNIFRITIFFPIETF